MFYDVKAVFLDGAFAVLGNVLCDLQPYDKTVTFEDNIEILITKRAFCAPSPFVTDKSYLLIGERLFKIMHIKSWESYLELWLSESERGLP